MRKNTNLSRNTTMTINTNMKINTNMSYNTIMRKITNITINTKMIKIRKMTKNTKMRSKIKTMHITKTMHMSLLYLGLEYLCQVFGILAEYEEGYMLHELEASAFLPYLINKMGDPKVPFYIHI